MFVTRICTLVEIDNCLKALVAEYGVPIRMPVITPLSDERVLIVVLL